LSADASGINNNGDIVLNCAELLGPNQYFWHGFLLRSGIYTKIDFPGAAPTGIPGIASGTFLRGISDAGLIVGVSIDSKAISRDYLTADFGRTFTPFECPAGMVDPPTIEGMSTDGKIVGECLQPVPLGFRVRNFLYTEGQFAFIDDVPG